MRTTDTGTHSHISRCTHACQLARALARAHAERHTNTQQQHKQNASALEEFLLSEVDHWGPVREEMLSASNQRGAWMSYWNLHLLTHIKKKKKRMKVQHVYAYTKVLHTRNTWNRENDGEFFTCSKRLHKETNQTAAAGKLNNAPSFGIRLAAWLEVTRSMSDNQNLQCLISV